MRIRPSWASSTAAAFLLAAAPMASAADKPLPHRVFVTSRARVDDVLARPYDAEVPFGASGDRVWATSPQGWAFRDGVQIIYRTNLNLFDLDVRSGEVRYVVDRAEYHPSHVHLLGAPGWPMEASASYTHPTDRAENPLTLPFTPAKRWTCWDSKRREDWWAADFAKERTLAGFDLYFFDDQPTGGCAPPESVTVELYRGGWRKAAIAPLDPKPGKNSVRFAGGPERAERVRLTFRHRGENLYTGLYGFDPRFTDRLPNPLEITGDKWITRDDVLVAQIVARNRTNRAQPLSVRLQTPLGKSERLPFVYEDQRDVQGFPLTLVAAGSDEAAAVVRPGEDWIATFACAVADDSATAHARLRAWIDTGARARQIAEYQSWFDRNVAHFECSDASVTRMYWHRWYNLKKNAMDPRLGALRHKTFAEGRWTSDWYANVISYGAGHQVREARWLRDGSFAWGHLQTWTDNPRPDGIFPSHITPKGQQGGQYTDWITATAWDAHLVHPNRPVLATMADALAKNAEGWRRVYGWGNSPLLVVDSHWWTGMEWQPSFFSFAGYRTDTNGEADLRRVDLTAYNFGNARAVAHIMKDLGRDAARFDALAEETRAAVLKEMWSPQTHWLHSLRATDNAPAPDKEIIGVYPFYFDLPPAGKGYEAAWTSLFDPSLFWTRWPLASVAKDSPAYSQTDWPVGPGGSVCMWNGPTWPHANSLVLTAMANTLRHYGPSAVTKQRLLDLFTSFTRAQYRNQDPRYPWTGEYYNGDTGVWKTEQRDYNHSTWIDPLIHDLVGLVARPDDVLEIDPLVPPDAWTYFLLDGQSYRGHDVTVVWDAKGGRYARGLKGFAVYLDGKQIHRSERIERVRYKMKEALVPRGATLTPVPSPASGRGVPITLLSSASRESGDGWALGTPLPLAGEGTGVRVAPGTGDG